MTGIKFLSVVAIACTSSTAASARPSADWDIYANARYGFQVCYPRSLVPKGESANSDGQTFRARDGGELLVWGENNVLEKGLVAMSEDRGRELAGENGRITYRARGPHWAVISGAGDHGRLFYRKAFERGDQFVTLELTYPGRAAAEYRAIATQLSHCFRIAARPGF